MPKHITIKEDPQGNIEYELIIEGNSFGDQILSVKHYNKDGSFHYPWCDTNMEGSHTNVYSKAFASVLSKILGVTIKQIKQT